MFTKMLQRESRPGGLVNFEQLGAVYAASSATHVPKAEPGKRDLADPILQRLWSLPRKGDKALRTLIVERVEFNVSAKELIDRMAGTIAGKKREMLKAKLSEIKKLGREQEILVQRLHDERLEYQSAMVNADSRIDVARQRRDEAKEELCKLIRWGWATDAAIASAQKNVESAEEKLPKLSESAAEYRRYYNLLGTERIAAETKKLNDLREERERCIAEMNGYDPSTIGLGLPLLPMVIESLDSSDPILSCLRTMATWSRSNASEEQQRLLELISEREALNIRAQEFCDSRTVRMVEYLEKKQVELRRLHAIEVNRQPVDRDRVDELALALRRTEAEMNGVDPEFAELGFVGTVR